MTQEMLALIMCGGKGERIKDFCSDKAMLKFNNNPLIEHVLISLRAMEGGITSMISFDSSFMPLLPKMRQPIISICCTKPGHLETA